MQAVGVLAELADQAGEGVEERVGQCIAGAAIDRPSGRVEDHLPYEARCGEDPGGARIDQLWSEVNGDRFDRVQSRSVLGSGGDERCLLGRQQVAARSRLYLCGAARCVDELMKVVAVPSADQIDTVVWVRARSDVEAGSDVDETTRVRNGPNHGRSRKDGHRL
jgi:hypothetical protein